MSKLNKDILFLLFEELQDDSKSLFSCLIVNKLWCEIIIPILWKNPWRYTIDYHISGSLYYVITFYLPDEIKEFLTEQGIQLPAISYKSLLFDYLSFCKSMNMVVIDDIIAIGSSDYNHFLLQQEIYTLFIRKCSKLKYLNIISIKHQIFYFPEAKVRLESLCELKCDTTIDPIYFYGLARICQNIQRLIIINTDLKANHGIVKLIEVQKNLKYFEWKDNFDEYDDNSNFITDPYEENFLALTKKADTLNHFIIAFQFINYFEPYEHVFLEKVLPEFRKLKTLTIDTLMLSGGNQLENLTYHDLEIFKIDGINIYTVACMIENSGGYLREISLKHHYYEDNFNEDSLILIRKIYENCPLIEYLSLVFSSSREHFVELEKLLKSCKKLKSLLITKYRYIKHKPSKEKFVDGENLLKILIRFASNNLREIKISDNFKFSLEILGEFLNSWKGRPSISIITSDPIYGGEDYIKLINKYKDDGVIKEFRRDSETNMYF